ncbi:MAG TPA: selenocysteine-specific translation elongation factor [Ktedonobacteraceae bacterium]|nr:selenocysteine-specific translation elongation factor [Ktedonobacteraceae bacterium]
MSCIGTAGHVDHGKSTLVKVLTGIDPDRLAEEKERGMTIDLGFAWLKLPGGREVSIVDVPGHESFIKNMLAGVGGIDAALLVVAADEGVMPQTREHLAILDLLRVRRGVVALTKADLVDEEWLELVREEVQEQLKPTTLANAPIIPVSAYTGQGLPALLTQLEQVLDETQERENIARPRLPIDRVFTMTGFGTVVTGTLLDGSFKLGQEIEVLPQAIRTRIRTLQTHRHQVEVAHPGSRVAINLANVARTDLERGNIVALPGQLRPTILIDAHIQLLADAPRPLTHNTLVDFYSGSQEVPARIRLLDVEELKPGQSSWVQLRLSRPAVVARRDRFILRIPSPSITIGGGEVVDVQPRYHRRFQPSVLNALATLERGSPEELVLAALDRRRERTVGAGVVGSGEEELASARVKKKDGTQPTARSAGGGARLLHGLIGYDLADIVKHSNLSQDVTQQTLETLLKAGRVRRIGLLWFAQPVWEALADEAIRLVREQHRQYPLRSGLSKEEWRTRLHLSAKMATEVFTALHAEGLLESVTGEAGITGGFIRLPGFIPTFTAAQEQLVERLLRKFYQSPYTPPVYAEAESIVGPEILASLIEQGRLVKLSDGVLFLRETHDEAVAKLVAYLKEHGKMTAAEARDVLGTSRKYVLPLLEHMDEQRITRRKGDDRVLAMQA